MKMDIQNSSPFQVIKTLFIALVFLFPSVALAAPSGTIHLPFPGQSFNNNIMVSATVDDPDGVGVALMRFSSGASITLCTGCGTGGRYTQSGIFPGSLGLGSGSHAVDLLVGPDTANLTIVDSTSFSWNPRVIDGIDVTRTVGNIEISWSPASGIARYNVYLASEQNISPSTINSLADSQVTYGINGTSTSFVVTDDELGMFALVSGSDSSGESAFSSVFRIEAFDNQDPTIGEDAFELNEDTSVTGNVLENDTDPEGDDLTAELVEQPLNGTVEFSTDGSFTYTPDANFNGEDSFIYNAIDTIDGVGIGTVRLTILPISDPPVATDDNFETSEDTNLTVDALNGLLANDADVDAGDELVVVSPGEIIVSLGDLSVSLDGSFTYSPPDDFSGEVQFDYTVSDVNGDTDSATVTIVVTPLNDAPVANDDSYAATTENLLTIDASLGVLANDTDTNLAGEDSSVSLSATILTTTTNGTLSLSSDGSFTYQANTGFSGEDSFTYQATDEAGLTADATVTIAVTQNATAPTANDDSYATDEGTPLSVDAANGVLANDTNLTNSGVDSTIVTVNLLSEPSGGALVLNDDGSFTYTPNDSTTGSDSFTYELQKIPGGSDTATVTITLNPVATPPVANNDNYATDRGVTLTVDAANGLMANDTNLTDTGFDDITVSVAISTEPENGSVSLAEDGSFSYTPTDGFAGTDTFTYQLTKTPGGADTATVTITVNNVNTAPTATEDNYSLDEDTVLTITAADGVLSNDDDLDGDTLLASLAEEPSSGSLQLSEDGSFTYTPNADFFGSDTFTYQVSDGGPETSQAQVILTISPVNDVPLANDDSYTTNEDEILTISDVTLGLLANDSDADLSEDTRYTELSVSLLQAPDTGELSLQANGTFTYTPPLNFFGDISFTYQVSDSAGETASASVTISVVNAQDLPIAEDDSYAVDEDTTLTVSAEEGLLTNDSDPEGQALSVTSTITLPANGDVSINLDGSFSYTPNSDFNGADTFTYQVSDSAGGTATGNVSISINQINDAPVAVDDTVSVAESSSQTLTPLDNDSDVDNDPLRIESASAVNGQLTFTETQINYTAPDTEGTDTVTYTISDGLLTASASIAIAVTGVNDAPVANPDTATTDEDTTVTIDVLANDTDEDGDTLTISSASATSGSVEIIGNQLSYSPTANFNGTATLTYIISDPSNATSSASVTVTVTAVNDAPSVVSDSVTTNEDTAVTINPLSNDSDVENDTLIIQTVSAVTGTAVLDGDTAITYTPEADFNGSVDITYLASDQNGGTSTGTISVTVNAVNDSPVTGEDTAAALQGETINITPLDNDTDVDGDTLTITEATATTGTVTIDSTSTSLSFTAQTDTTDTVTINYAVSDGNGGTATGTVTVSVTDTNFAPVGNTDSAEVFAGESVEITPLSNDTDADGDTLSVTAASTDVGTVSISTDATTITYTAPSDTTTTATISYTVADPTGATDSSTISVSISEQTLTGDFDPDGDGTSDVSAVTSGSDYVLSFGNDVESVYYLEDGETVSVTANDSGSFEITVGSTATVNRLVPLKKNGTGVWVQDDFRIDGANTVEIFYTVNGIEYSFTITNLDQPNANIAFGPPTTLSSDFSGNNSFEFYTKYKPFAGALRTGVENGMYYDLDSSGNGRYGDTHAPSEVMWSIVNGVIHVDFVSAPEDSEFRSVYDLDDDSSDGIAMGVIPRAEADAYVSATGSSFVETFVSAYQDRITLTKNNRVSKEVNIERFFGYRIDSSANPTITSAQTPQVSAITENNSQLLLNLDDLKQRPITTNILLSSEIVLDVPRFDSTFTFEEFSAESCTFSQTSTVSQTDIVTLIFGSANCTDGSNFDWTLEEGTTNPRFYSSYANGDITVEYFWLDQLAIENTFAVKVQDVRYANNIYQIKHYTTLGYWMPFANQPSDVDITGLIGNGYMESSYLLSNPDAYDSTRNLSAFSANGVYFDYSGTGASGFAKSIYGYTNVHGQPFIDDIDRHWQLSMGLLELESRTNILSNDDFRYVTSQCVDMQNQDCFVWQKQSLRVLAISGSRIWVAESEEQNEQGINYGNGINYVTTRPSAIHYYQNQSSVPGAPNSISFNQEPVTDFFQLETELDTALSNINVLTYASDPEGDSLSVVNATAFNGTASVNTDNTINYTPNAGYIGNDGLYYDISDGINTRTFYVQVTVRGQNVAPVAVDDTASAFSGLETIISPLTNDTDTNNDSLILTSVSSDVGTAAIDTSDNTQFSFRSGTTFSGNAVVTYTVSDQRGGTDTGTVPISVSPASIGGSYDLDNSGQSDFNIIANGNLYDLTFSSDVSAAYVMLNGQRYPLARSSDGSFKFVIDPSDTVQPEIFYVINGVSYSFTPQNLSTSPAIGFGVTTALSNDFGLASSYNLITRSPMFNASLSTAFENGMQYNLNSDNTGIFSSSTGYDTVTWSASSGTITVTFDNPTERTVFYNVYDLDDENNNDGALGVITRAEADAYVSTHGRNFVDVQVASVRHELTGTQNNGYYFDTDQNIVERLRIDTTKWPIFTSSNAINGVEASFAFNQIDLISTDAINFIGFASNDITGGMYLPIGRADGSGNFTEFAADFCSFSEISTGTGNGSCPLSGQSFSWAIGTDGSLALTLSNGLSLNYQWFTDSPVENTVFITATDSGAKRFTKLDFWMPPMSFTQSEVSSLLSGNYMEISGIVTNEFNYDSTGTLRDDLGQGFYLDTNGQAKQMFTYLNSDNTARTIDNDFFWSADSAGNVVLEARSNASSSDTYLYTYSQCADSADANCFVWILREWVPLAIDNGRLWVLETEMQDSGSGYYNGSLDYQESLVPQIHFYELRSPVPGAPNSLSYNQEPYAYTAVMTAQDTPITVDISAIVLDPENDPITITDYSSNDGTVLINGDGTITYTPSAGYNGNTNITLELSDGTNIGYFGFVNVKVGVFNTNPIAYDDIENATGGHTYRFDVTFNDYDDDGDRLTITSIFGAVNASISADRTAIDYNAPAGVTITETVEYEISDGNGGSDFGTLTINVTPNVAPVANNDTASVTSGSNVFIYPLDNDTDANGDFLNIDTATSAEGSAVISPDGQSIDFTPSITSGTATISYTATDSVAISNTATITVTVNSNNTAPIANDDNYSVALSSVNVLPVLDNDYDPDTDTITIVSTSTNATRTSDDLQINYTAPASGTSDTITYTIDDGNGGQDSATVFITLDNPPTAVNDSETVQVGVSTTLFPLINDSDPEGIGTVTITSLGYTGSGSAIIANDTISIDYTAPTSSGSDTISYTITDAVGNTASATITITVTVANTPNTPPATNSDSYTILSDGSTATIDVSAGVLINDTDSDGDTLTVTINAPPTQSSAFALNSDGSFTYQHNGGSTTVDSFTYNVSDGITSSTGTVNLSIQKDNFAPEICTIPKYYARQGEQYNLRVNVNDLDHSSFTFDDSGKPTWFDASVTSSSDIQLLGTPSASDVGSHSVSITASDGIDFTTLSYNLTVIPEFGTSGSSIVNFGGTTETVHAAAIDNFGNIVIVGESDSDFAVARVSPAGTLDAGFGTNGVATFNIGSGTDIAKQVLILPNNGILVVGESDNGSGSDLAVIALTESGTLDTSFDSDGIYTLDPFGGSNIDTVTDAIIFNNDKIVISGYSFVGANYEGFIVQLNADGTIDNSFDTDGIWSINNSPYDVKLSSLLKDNEGLIYSAGMVGGAVGDDGLLVRFKSGALDTNFNSTGVFSFDLGGSEASQDALFDRSGNIIVAGKKDSVISATRITISSSGNTDTPSIDSSFETNFTTPSSAFNGGVVPNGEIQNLLSDYRGNYYLTFVDGAASYGVRISPDGNLDSTYATNGIKAVPLSSGVTGTPSVAVLDAFGQLLYVDTQNPSANDEIVLTYDYILDSPEFGTCDIASEFVGTASKTIDFVSHAAKAPDNDYFVVGWSQALDDSNKDLAVLKTDIDGHLDATWGEAGVSRIDIGKSVDSADQQVIALNNNEAILVTNDSTGSNVILVKLNDLGELDSGFGTNGIYDLTGIVTIPIVDTAHDSSTNAFYLLGEDSSNLARIYRFNADGTFDNSFGVGTGTSANTGVNYTIVNDGNFSPNGMVVRSSGEIALVGSFYDVGTGYNKTAVVLMDNSGVINYSGSWLITVDDGQAMSGISADTDGSNIFVLAKNSTNVARVYKFNNSTGLDPSFYGSGQTELSNYYVSDGVESIRVDSTGQLWVNVSDASSNKFMLRLTSTGEFDASFINAGQVKLSHGIATWSSGAGVAGFELNSNDNAFIYGYTNQDFILAKMNSSGVVENPVDLTQFDFGFGENSRDIELDAYSSPILAGSSYNTSRFDTDFAMTRFDNAGNGDNSFGDSGVGANVAGSIGTQDFNTLVGVGAATHDIYTSLNLSDSGHNYASGIWQLTTDDNSDVVFTRTNNATATLDVDPPYSVSDYDLAGSSLPDQVNDSYLTDDGSQFVVGQAGGQAYVLKLLPGGGLDTTFNSGGVLNPISSTESSFNAITVAQDGDLLLAGYAVDSVYGKGIIAKISKDGVLDSSFGNMGVVEENGGENIEFRDIAIGANAEIFAVGRSFDFSLNSGNSFIASYTNNGTLDTTFDSDGLMTQNLSTDELIESFVDVELDAFGALVLLAQIGNEFAIYRMSDTGAALSSPVGNFSYGAITKMREMEIDTLGNIYVTGAVQYQQQWQFFVVRFPNAIGPY
ncbi:MAG: tandem-95 repeat protein [Alteromonadaceae bacterium]|nr:tandem-95 repeat protein [Alteromonadaceae bacterium]